MHSFMKINFLTVKLIEASSLLNFVKELHLFLKWTRREIQDLLNKSF